MAEDVWYTYDHYGISTRRKLNPLMLELFCFRHGFCADNGYPLCLGKEGHFKRCARMLWPTPEECGEKRGKAFYWHPWAERGLSVLCRYQYPALSGCASSGKTELGAIWALINWLCAPSETLVLVTSTSLKDSRKRIWGSIVEHFQAVPGLPGKLIDSEGIIRTMGADGKISDRCGIALIAGDKRKEREAIGKLIGIKAKRLIMVADELPELSPALVEAALSNLASNEGFQMVGLGNFASIYDPFGEFSAPKDGWESVSINDEEWETKLGWCIRFDGLKSPNIQMGKDEWPFLYNSKTLSKHRETLGDKSSGFWRFCRSFPAPEGSEDAIFVESHFLMGKAYEPSRPWLSAPTKIAAFDPSYTSGGDRPFLRLGEYGIAVDGKPQLVLHKSYTIRENVLLKEVPRSHQIVEQVVKHCLQFGVERKHFGCDTTGGGSVFADMFDARKDWDSGKVWRVCFGGAPSELPISRWERTTARDKYVDKVTELWHVAQEFVADGQIRGVPRELARELKSRVYEMVKGAQTRKVAESKRDMRDRLGYSPDDGDSFCILVDLVRNRLGARIGSVDSRRNVKQTDWQQAVRDANRVYRRADYSHEQPKEKLYATST